MIKSALTILLTISFVFGAKVGYVHTFPIESHLLFHFSHANIYHLFCNLFALYAIKGDLHMVEAYILATLASFIPTYPLIYQPTMGFSGVLFAIVGIKWGEYFFYIAHLPSTQIYLPAFKKNVRNFLVYIITPLFITFFIPNINWLLHVYSLLFGLLFAGLTWNLQGNRK